MKHYICSLWVGVALAFVTGCAESPPRLSATSALGRGEALAEAVRSVGVDGLRVVILTDAGTNAEGRDEVQALQKTLDAAGARGVEWVPLNFGGNRDPLFRSVDMVVIQDLLESRSDVRLLISLAGLPSREWLQANAAMPDPVRVICVGDDISGAELLVAEGLIAAVVVPERDDIWAEDRAPDSSVAQPAVTSYRILQRASR